MHRGILGVVLGVVATGVSFVALPRNSSCVTDCKQVNTAAYEKYRAQLSKVDFASQPAPIAVCFAPGTDIAIINAFQQALSELQDGAWPEPGSRYQIGTRWTGTQGDPKALTWSFVPDGLSIPGGAGEGAAASTLFASMDAKFGGNRAAWIAQFDAIFARWAEVSGLTYTRVTNGTDAWDDNAAWGTPGDANTGDIRIAMKNIDGGSGILAYNAFPQSGDMVIDASENWGNNTNNYRFLRNTLSHEHGHGIGLYHVCPGNGSKLMEPYLAVGFDGPQQDEIRAGNRSYGDRFEPNNSQAQASQLGALAVGGTLSVGNLTAVNNAAALSIDENGEEDFYKFPVTGPTRLTATLIPVGSTYLNGPQVGGCDIGSPLNALTQADLNFQILNSAGTALATGASTVAGLNESVVVDLPAAGTYTVRVYEGNAPTESQLYRLNLSAGSASAVISGTITFLDWVNPNRSLPITLTVRNATTGAVIQSVSGNTNSIGNYSLSVFGLAPGTTYTFQADSLMWLRKSMNFTTPAGLNVSGLNFALTNGDSDGSGEVDAADIDNVISNFGESASSPGFTFAADIDGSQEVDAADIDIVIANFGQTNN